MRPITTFSIVAYDPGRRQWGVAVQSKFLAVGAVVPWARAGAGVVATQSYANLSYGPRGLDLMAGGLSAAETIAALVADDKDRALRQVGVVDGEGRAAAYTGAACHPWAGHITGDGFACQGNLLIPGTVEAMAARFEQARGGRASWPIGWSRLGRGPGGRRRQTGPASSQRAGRGRKWRLRRPHRPLSRPARR